MMLKNNKISGENTLFINDKDVPSPQVKGDDQGGLERPKFGELKESYYICFKLTVFFLMLLLLKSVKPKNILT